MDFAAMKLETMARVQGATDTRAGFWVNSARAELDRMYLWPWREKAVTGTAPLTVADLGVIEAVTNETGDYPLEVSQFRWLLEYYGDLSTEGAPSCYYVARPAGDPVVATYPTNGDTIGVQYYKVSADLSADGDEPDSPTEVHYLIVDMAVARGLRSYARHAEAMPLQQDITRQLGTLLQQYPPGASDGQGHVVIPTGW